MHQIRYGLRRLGRERGFTAAAVLTLAMAIGACTAMFSVVQAVLLRPIGVDLPARVVMMWPTHQGTVGEFPYRTQADMRALMPVFDHVAVVGSVNWSAAVSIGGAEPVVMPMAGVSGAFFDVLGARPLLGRTFRAEDDVVSAPRVLVLSHGTWLRRFGGDPAVIGRRVRAEGDTIEIVGVMAPEFFFPRGAEYWTPAGPLLATYARQNKDPIDKVLTGLGVFYGIGRLKAGVSIANARAETGAFLTALDDKSGLLTNAAITVTPLMDHIFGSARPALVVLMIAVLIVLLIASVNVSGLLVARGQARDREMAVRVALGAGRGVLVGQLLVESAILALAGACLGVTGAALGLQTLVQLSPADIPRLGATSLDAGVLVFAIVVTAATTVLVGLVPAWRLSRPSPMTELKSGGTTVARSDRIRLRTTLIGLQVAATLVLLTATALCIQSFARLSRLDLGFDPANVLTFGLSAPDGARPPVRAERDAFLERVIQRFERDPRVITAGAVLQRPFANGPIGWDSGVVLEGQARTPEAMARNPTANFEAITPHYFQAMGIRMIRGRAFDERDTGEAPRVVIVSEALAARIWPGQDPIGKRISDSFTASRAKGTDLPWMTVVGVVSTARYREIESPRLDLYVPFRQSDIEVQHFIVRTSAPPLSVASALAADVAAENARTTLDDVTTMDAIVRRTRGAWHFNMLVFTLFGLVALGLSAIGLFALVAHAVSRRTREIGIRIALGADRRQVVGLMLSEGLRPMAAGLAVGLVASLLATRAMTRLLFETSPTDPLAFGSVSVLLVAVAALASYLPARRAASVDPLVVLRDE